MDSLEQGQLHRRRVQRTQAEGLDRRIRSAAGRSYAVSIKVLHHIDGNLSNNDPSNLRLVGAEENRVDLAETMTPEEEKLLTEALMPAAKKIVELEELLKRWVICFGDLADSKLRRETRQALESIK